MSWESISEYRLLSYDLLSISVAFFNCSQLILFLGCYLLLVTASLGGSARRVHGMEPRPMLEFSIFNVLNVGLMGVKKRVFFHFQLVQSPKHSDFQEDMATPAFALPLAADNPSRPYCRWGIASVCTSYPISRNLLYDFGEVVERLRNVVTKYFDVVQLLQYNSLLFCLMLPLYYGFLVQFIRIILVYFRILSMKPATLLKVMIGCLVLNLYFGLEFSESVEILPLETGSLLKKLEYV